MPAREKSFDEALAAAVKMSERYVAKGPYKFFPDPVIVDEVQRGLAKNDIVHGKRYCPWMIVEGDPVQDRKKICPCSRHHEDIARDGFCIWMFFVSEEFLRRWEQGEEPQSTLGDVLAPGESLFPEHLPTKAEQRDRARERKAGEDA